MAEETTLDATDKKEGSSSPPTSNQGLQQKDACNSSESLCVLTSSVSGLN